MRIKLTIGMMTAALLVFAPACNAGELLAARPKPAPVNATPVPKVQLAACRFWQCNCRRECVIYEGSRCVQSVQTCETCSECSD